MARYGALPSQLPVGSAQTIVTYLRGQLTDKWTAVEAAYDLLGYGLHLARGVTGRSPVAGVPTDADACVEFESLIRDQQRIVAQSPKPTPTPTPSEEETEAPAPPPKLVGQLSVPPWLTAFLLQMLQKLLTT